MRLLLDNTGLHRVHVVTSSTSAQNRVSLSDAMALFHFAEHIMFTDGIIVSTFEIPRIRETSEEAISRLLTHGCISLSEGRSLLASEDFGKDEYGDACRKAAPFIQEDLQLLDTRTLTHAGRLADFRTKPIGVTSPAMEKWVSRQWSRAERRRLIESALEEKARGAFDYIVASHDPIYRLIQDLARSTRGKKIFTLAMLLDVVFRVAINEKLSELRKCTYAPAPQRAKVTHETDHLFRHAVARMIQDLATENQSSLASGLIAKVVATEQLPLPILAIHFLSGRNPNSPLKLLEVARELRDHSDVIYLRKWLSKWEGLYNSSDLKLKEKARQEIKDLKLSCRIMDKNIELFSIFRPEVSSGPDGSIHASFDLSGLAAPLVKLLAKASRRKIFLAALKREIVTDEKLGAAICRIIGRPIAC